MSIVFLLLLPMHALSQNAFLRQQQVYSGDITELTIIHDAGIPSLYSVDTTPLLTDFEVLGTESRIFQIRENNRSTHRMEWRARLLPKRTGSIAIPALEFGSHRSTPLTLEVVPVPTELEARQQVFVDIEVQPANPYPGQQTRIVYRLFHNLPLSSGSLREPEATQAQVFRSGRERRYQVERDGESFTVLERSILVLPLAPTNLSVLPAQISANLPAIEQDPLNSRDEGRYLHRKSKNLELPLRELPVGMDTRAWLPAEELEISMEWVERPKSLEPGDTLDLILNIQARGLAADALPADLLLVDSEHFTVYADPATRSTRVRGDPGDDYLVGQLRQRYAILVERAGETSLPALHLDWWDTTQDRARVAMLDAQPLSIGKPGNSVATGMGSPDSSASETNHPGTAFVFQLQLGWTALIATISGLALFSLAAWFLRNHGTAMRTRLAILRSRRLYLRRLRYACHHNDAAEARINLLGWSRLYWPNERINGIRQVAEITASTGWDKALARLDAAVYAQDSGAWQGRELWLLVQQQARQPGHNANTRQASRLPGPYPSPIHRAATSPQPV